MENQIKIPLATYCQFGNSRIISLKNNCQCEGNFIMSQSTMSTNDNKNINFLDLFWFYTPKKNLKINIPKNLSLDSYLELVTFNLNLNYGNLRINGYLNVSDSFHNNALFIDKNLLSINTAIYPSSLFYIRHLENGCNYSPIEQLFVPYNPKEESWHDDLSQSNFIKNNDRILMNIIKNDKHFFYIFEGKQLDLFNYALDFILSQGLTIVGNCKKK